MNFDSIDEFSASLNNTGTMIFKGSADLLNPAGWNEGIWLGTPGNLTLAAYSGDPVPEGYSVTIDGSGSLDPEETILTFVWSIGGVEVAIGPRYSTGSLAVGTHTVTLTVTDRGGASASDEMILTVTPNLAPVADAGPDQTVSHVETVNLDGAASSDPEGAVLTYVWSINGTQVATGAATTVGPFAVGEHVVTLTVTDDIGKSATDSMVVTVVNGAPVADAGPDRNILTLQSVWLDGSASSDPEEEALSYVWSTDGLPIAAGPTPIVWPFDAGVYAVTLTVTDGHGATATDSMVVIVINEAPVADAGSDQTVGVKGRTTTATLDGSGSSDPEGGALTYLWTLDGQTVGTGAVLEVTLGAGTFTFTLTVTDDHGITAFDTVVVTAVKGNV